VAGMNEGRSVHELMRDIALPPELEVGEGYGKVSWSVRAIWEAYAGWFHARSTTELYPVPTSAVHDDLVDLAGGTEALATRARTRLDDGEPVEAIHLAEIGLSVSPDDAGCLRVSREAHEQLLAKSENFWESSWLQKCIKELEALETDEG